MNSVVGLTAILSFFAVLAHTGGNFVIAVLIAFGAVVLIKLMYQVIARKLQGTRYGDEDLLIDMYRNLWSNIRFW